MNDMKNIVSFEEEFFCEGVLEAGDVTANLDMFSVTRHKHTHDAVISFLARTTSDFSQDVEKHAFNGKLVFKGKLSGHLDVHATCFATHKRKGEIKGIVEDLRIGIEEIFGQVVFQEISVYFTPTRLARPMVRDLVHYKSGEVVPFSKEEASDEMLLNWPIGSASFSSMYEPEDIFHGGERVVAKVAVPTLTIEVSEKHFNNRILRAIEDTADTVADLESVISYLSRRQVRWVEVCVVSKMGVGKDERFSHTRCLRYQSGSPAPEHDLVVSRWFGQRDLESVFAAFLSSPYRLPIGAAINFLNVRWGDGLSEEKFVMAFTAFETLINGIGEVDGTAVALKSGRFNRLRKEVKSLVKSFCERENIEREIAEDICNRTGELKRRPIVPRAVAIVEAYEVSWHDVWHEENLENALKKAFSLRNHFIHAGEIEDPVGMAAEAKRIHTLTERLIFRLLKCDKKWLNALS